MKIFLTKDFFLETLRNDLNIHYKDTDQTLEPLFDLEAFNLCTESTFPSVIFWGTKFKCFYNSGFSELMKFDGSTFFAKEGSIVFCKEAWKVLLPLLQEITSLKSSIGAQGQLIHLDRKGFLEECYFDYSLEPVFCGDLVLGVYCTLIESTKRILDQRRLNLLTQLSIENHQSNSIVQACEIVTNVLARFKEDIPYSLTYLIRPNEEGDQLCSEDIDENLKDLIRTKKAADKIEYIGGLKNPSSKAVLIPIKSSGQTNPFCMLILGISPKLELNDDYREFHTLLSGFLSTILSKIQLIECKQRDLVARDDFISIASHEFKTPITALKLRLALTKRKINIDQGTGPTMAEISECIKTADQQADRLLGLVDELLDMTRIQRGKFQIVFEELKVKDLLADMCRRFEDQLDRSGTRLTISISDDIQVRWHRSRMEQVLSNLMTNSLKYAPGADIRIEVKQEFSTVRITFEDTGPGIACDKLSRVVERFEGGQSSQREGGLGLGLFIVREIIRGHRGSIEVSSQEGQGCKFIISVPCEPVENPVV